VQFEQLKLVSNGLDHPAVTVKLAKDPVIFGDALAFIKGFVEAVKGRGGDESCATQLCK
jgi:hypothetical protein